MILVAHCVLSCRNKSHSAYLLAKIGQVATETFFQRIRQGDKKAFDELFLIYYGELCRFAYTFSTDFDSAEEIVQEMFVGLWEKRQTLIVPEKTKSYLYKSVYNQYLKYQRSESVRAKYHLNYFQFTWNEQEQDSALSEQILDYLSKAIDGLPEKCRQIFVLHKVQGMKQKEIAELLGISVKTVENQVAIAIHKLREELKPVIHLLPTGLLLFIFQ